MKKNELSHIKTCLDLTWWFKVIAFGDINYTQSFVRQRDVCTNRWLFLNFAVLRELHKIY